MLLPRHNMVDSAFFIAFFQFEPHDGFRQINIEIIIFANSLDAELLIHIVAKCPNQWQWLLLICNIGF